MKHTRWLLALALLPAPVLAFDWAADPVAQSAPALPDLRPAAAEKLECRPEVIEAFHEAWLRSDSGRKEYEAAFRVDPGYAITFVPMTHEAYKLPVEYFPATTLAIAHTHPDTAEPTPGPGDFKSKVPNYVISRDALYVTVPGTRQYRYVRRDWAKPCRA